MINSLHQSMCIINNNMWVITIIVARLEHLCVVCNKKKEGQTVYGNPCTLLGIKLVWKQLVLLSLPNAKMTNVVIKSMYDYLHDKFVEVYQELEMLPMHPIEYKIHLADYAELILYSHQYQILQKKL